MEQGEQGGMGVEGGEGEEDGEGVHQAEGQAEHREHEDLDEGHLEPHLVPLDSDSPEVLVSLQDLTPPPEAGDREEPEVAEDHDQEGDVGAEELQDGEDPGSDDGALSLGWVVPELAEDGVKLQESAEGQEEGEPGEDQLDRAREDVVLDSGVREERIVCENVGSVESYHCQGEPLGVHDAEAGEPDQLAVGLAEGQAVVEVGQGLVGHHHQAEQQVQQAQVDQQDLS